MNHLTIDVHHLTVDIHHMNHYEPPFVGDVGMVYGVCGMKNLAHPFVTFSCSSDWLTPGQAVDFTIDFWGSFWGFRTLRVPFF